MLSVKQKGMKDYEKDVLEQILVVWYFRTKTEWIGGKVQFWKIKH